MLIILAINSLRFWTSSLMRSNFNSSIGFPLPLGLFLLLTDISAGLWTNKQRNDVIITHIKCTNYRTSQSGKYYSLQSANFSWQHKMCMCMRYTDNQSYMWAIKCFIGMRLVMHIYKFCSLHPSTNVIKWLRQLFSRWIVTKLSNQ